MAKRLLNCWPAPDDWEWMDYDSVSCCVYDVINEFCSKATAEFNGWLKADCDVGETLLNHVTARARARDALRVFANNPDQARKSLANTIEFAAKKIIRLAA